MSTAVPAATEALLPRDLLRRLGQGAGANLLGKVWVALAQVVTIPVLLTGWGAEAYGTWLLLLTIPASLQLADLGLATAAAVEMSRRVVAGDASGAGAVFRTCWLGVTATSVAGAGLAVVVGAMLGPHLIETIAILSACGVLQLQMGFVSGVYRAQGRYARGTFLYDIVYPAEALALVAVVLAGGGLRDVAVAYLAVRLVAVLAYGAAAMRLAPWARFGAPNWALLPALTGPARAALVLGVANAFGLQGVMLALGVTAGPVAVAVFGPVRILARMPLQFAGLLGRASLPEFTRLLQAGSAEALRRLSRLNAAVALGVTVPCAVILAGFGSAILSWLSDGGLSAGPWLFGLMGLAATANATWTAVSLPLLAANKQGQFAYRYALACGAVMAVPFVARGDVLIWTAGALAVSELAMVLVVLRRGRGGVVSETRVLFFWDSLGPMHVDRLDAMARSGTEVIALQWSATSEVYAWEPVQSECFERVTVTSIRELGLVRRCVLLVRHALAARAGHNFLCHYERAEVFVAAAVLRLAGRRVYVMNDAKFDDKPRPVWREALKSVLYRPYHGALVGSRRSANYLRFLGFAPKPIRIGYDTVDVSRIVAQSGAVPAPGGMPFAERSFVVVARLVPKKNIEAALRAFAAYRGGGGTRRLVICGDGPLRGSLERLAAALGVGGEVDLLGQVGSTDVARTLAGGLALLLPSVEEQFGLVVIEAQALGLPVLVSDSVGARDELVRTGVNGFVVEPDNVAGLAYFMTCLGADEALWRAMSTAARDGAEKGDVRHFAAAVGALIAPAEGA